MPRIAIAQICPFSAPPGLPDFHPDHPSEPFSILTSNLAQVERCLQQAVAQSAEIVIFPEYFLQGILNENRQYLSLMSKHLEQALIRLAEKYGVGVVGTIVHGSANHLSAVPSVSPIPIGDAMKGEERNGAKEWTSFLKDNKEKLSITEELTLYNEAFYLDGDGVQGRYHKLNLWHPEREYLDPGVQKFPVFETKWGKAGFLICWDLSHPAEAQELASQGADIIFAPMYWLGVDSDPVASSVNPDPNYERTLVQSLSYARAFETECILISCNAGGDRQKDGFMGGSGIWAPLLGKIGGFEDERVGVEVVEVDMGILKKARDLYKIREDADKRCG